MKKFNFRKIILILIILILLFPIPMHLKDGGSIRYQALLYSVTRINRLKGDFDKENIKGWEVEVLNMKIYSNIK